MERRFILFLVLSFGILLLWSWLTPKPPPPRQPAQKQVAAKDGEKGGKAVEKKKAESKPAAKEPVKAAEKPGKPGPIIQAKPQPKVPEQWVVLGSADSDAPYRMLVTLTNAGAAVERIELNSPRYCDIDNRSGYLGRLVMKSHAAANGCRIEVVPPGTPADKAKLRPGDEIKSFNGKPVADYRSLEAMLANTKPRQKVKIVVVREGKEEEHEARLSRIPLEVVKPEAGSPCSMLLTLQQYDAQKITDKEKADKDKWAIEDKDEKRTEAEEAVLKVSRHEELISGELDGLHLRTANWEVVPSGNKDVARFRYTLPEKHLEITKTYSLVPVPAESQKEESYSAYHLLFEIEIHNIARGPDESHKVAYRLDGPNGLPTEGAWYASRVTRCGGIGLREFIISMGERTPVMEDAATIVAGGKGLPESPDVPPDRMMTFIGVDAQYFSALLMPQRKNPQEIWFDSLTPIYVGKADPQQPKLINTSCRLVSIVKNLKPGETLTHKFNFFTGPKKEDIVKPYGLGDLIYYGWYGFVAEPLTRILHWFYAIVGNYGIAIIMLTILVRGCMFPLSLKQAAGAQKMQMLQPELKKLQEKHKGNSEARAKAQQELFKKHNYNPLAGCLPIFIQMPVFIGLYRALMVAIELRDAPLFSNWIQWCSNLASPDMLFDWRAWWPQWFNEGNSMLALGPYFNLLPILTIVLFIVQQKMFMPPAADDQAAMTQKMMKYMMIFMGVLFYKVASGLCIYFIASSLWGLAERRFLPKATPPATAGDAETRAEVKARERADAAAAAAAAAKKKK
jgi:YidC/Oxa1 family membrane protein insertase